MKWTLIKQPNGFLSLCYLEMWDRFIFYGARSILVLYLINTFSFSMTRAFEFYGVFMALGFALQVFGGLFGDRYLGQRQTVFIGTVFILFASLILLSHSFYALIIGLSLLMLGISLMKPNTVSLIGQLYKHSNQNAQSGFTLFYMAMNIGAMLGPICFGILSSIFDWRGGFFVCFLGFLSAFLLLVFNRRFYFLEIKHSLFISKIKLIYLLILFFIFILIFYCFLNPFIAHYLIGLILFLSCLFAFYLINKLNKQERRITYGLILLILTTSFFFAGNVQGGSSLILFIKQSFSHQIGSFTIPIATITSFEPIGIFILSPLFTIGWAILHKKRVPMSIQTKFIIGIGFICLCFFMLALLAFHATQKPIFYSLIWVFITYLLISAAELLIIPSLFEMITHTAPKHLVGSLLGLTFMGDTLGSLIATQLTKANQLAFIKPYLNNLFVADFSLTAMLLLLVGFSFFIFSSTIQRFLTQQTT